MKKFMYAVALLLGMSALLVSCNKDNSNDYTKLIVGTWEVVTYDTYQNGFLLQSEPGDGITFTFTAEGKWFSNVLAPDIKGDYSISGNKLRVISISMKPEESTILKLTNTEMQLESTESKSVSGGSEEYRTIITYKKVK